MIIGIQRSERIRYQQHERSAHYRRNSPVQQFKGDEDIDDQEDDGGDPEGRPDCARHVDVF